MNQVQTKSPKFCVTTSLNYMKVKASSKEYGTFFKTELEDRKLA